MTAPLGGMLTLILLITAGAVLIIGAAFAMVNDLSPAELARESGEVLPSWLPVAGAVAQQIGHEVRGTALSQIHLGQCPN